MIHLVTPINPVPQAKRERIATLTRLEDTVKKKLAEEAARRPPRTKQQKLQKQMELRLKVCGLAARPLANDDACGASPVRRPLV